jgi:HD-GYP domain-containing protein (c-di-GMP phosphodiesterase class II)
MVRKLLDKLSQKSYESENHISRMVEYADLLGKKINLDLNQLIELWLLANLHDIGEVTIPKNILIKNNTLTEKEWKRIKKHPKEGHNIIKKVDEFSLVADKILYHHEHWDGSGYPGGIKGENIPLLSRMIAIVDAYEVMITERPYSPSMSKENALAEIDRCSGRQFDPELAKVFIEMMK